MIDDAKFSEISAALTDDLGLECAKTLDDGRCRYWDTPSTDSGFIRAFLSVQYKKHHDGSSSFIVESYPKTFLLVLSYTAVRHKKAEQLLLSYFAGELTRAERQHRNLGRDTFTDLRCTQGVCRVKRGYVSGGQPEFLSLAMGLFTARSR